MQGTYRIEDPGGELTEAFVAAPGPMGWRYFGRAHRTATQEPVYTVDHVVDATWNLVRFRMGEASSGDEALLVPAAGGLESVLTLDGRRHAPIRTEATAAWCLSPCSVLVAGRLLSSLAGREVRAIRIPRELRRLRDEDQLEDFRDLSPVRVHHASRPGRPAGGGLEWSRFSVDGNPLDVLSRAGLPVSAEGWFELTG
jgi:hypothetical protein